MYGNEEEDSVKKKSEQSAARIRIQERKTAYRKMKLTIFTMAEDGKDTLILSHEVISIFYG